ncbi:hypothetical protein Tco_1222065 [Tanacetum coccineum]
MNELNELRDQAYENSLIYKEKMKKIHDSKIKNRVFNVGDRVLLFNSRLNIFSYKLKTRWTGPFTVAQVFPYGTVELSQTDGPNFKVSDIHLNGTKRTPKTDKNVHELEGARRRLPESEDIGILLGQPKELKAEIEIKETQNENKGYDLRLGEHSLILLTEETHIEDLEASPSAINRD